MRDWRRPRAYAARAADARLALSPARDERPGGEVYWFWLTIDSGRPRRVAAATHRLGEAVRRLTADGARVIVLNLLLAESQRPCLRRPASCWRRRRPRCLPPRRSSRRLELALARRRSRRGLGGGVGRCWQRGRALRLRTGSGPGKCRASSRPGCAKPPIASMPPLANPMPGRPWSRRRDRPGRRARCRCRHGRPRSLLARVRRHLAGRPADVAFGDDYYPSLAVEAARLCLEVARDRVGRGATRGVRIGEPFCRSTGPAGSSSITTGRSGLCPPIRWRRCWAASRRRAHSPGRSSCWAPRRPVRATGSRRRTRAGCPVASSLRHRHRQHPHRSARCGATRRPGALGGLAPRADGAGSGAAVGPPLAAGLAWQPSAMLARPRGLRVTAAGASPPATLAGGPGTECRGRPGRPRGRGCGLAEEQPTPAPPGATARQPRALLRAVRGRKVAASDAPDRPRPNAGGR